MQNTAQGQTEAAGYGLRREVLSPMETLAAVGFHNCAHDDSGGHYSAGLRAGRQRHVREPRVLATGAILLVSLCVGKFARY